MGLEPVLAASNIDDDRKAKIDGGFHLLFNDASHVVFFGLEEIKQEFIVNLQQHSRLPAVSAELSMNVRHGNFDHVGRRTLDWSINGIPFGGGADGPVRRIDVANVAAAAGHSFDVATLAGKGD